MYQGAEYDPIKHQKTHRIHKAALDFLLVWADSTELPALHWIERQRKCGRPNNKSFQGRQFEAWSRTRAKVRKYRPALWQETLVPLQPPHNTPQPPCCHGYGSDMGAQRQGPFLCSQRCGYATVTPSGVIVLRWKTESLSFNHLQTHPGAAPPIYIQRKKSGAPLMNCAKISPSQMRETKHEVLK